MQTTPPNQVPSSAPAHRNHSNDQAAQDGIYHHEDITGIAEDREGGSSEWSLSPSESTSTSALESWLSAPPTQELRGHSDIDLVRIEAGIRSSHPLRRTNFLGDRSLLGDAPEGGSWY